MGRLQRPASMVFSLAIALALSGCFGPPAASPGASSSSPSPATTQSPSPTAAPTPPATAPPSSTTPSPTPTSPAPSTTAAPSSTGLPEQLAPLTIYYVAVGDNGASGPMIGCGDSLVATHTAPVRFTDQVGPSIRTLLDNKSRSVGMSGLVNVLSQSTLAYVGGSFDGTTITIYLTGQFMLAGECDIPRAKAQLEFTAMTAAGATRAAVFVNGRPIDEVLSLK
ncbi:hypothetical protein [Sinomonas sp. G460-2]|uniref:hypothetical protein n=1 Tax=Sinomonas sp. G460-2 TaxID=3393464 RepID=UPI0039EE59E6